MRECNTNIKYLSHIYKSFKTGLPAYLRSLLSFSSHRSTWSSSPITLSRPSLTSCLKIANRSYYHSAPVLWNSLPSDLPHVAHHVTPSPVLNSPVSDLSTSLFLKNLKPISFTLPFLFSLYRLSQDWYLRYWPSFVISSYTHFAIIHPHFIHTIFILFDL